MISGSDKMLLFSLGIHIGNGTMIGENCMACGNVESYTIIIGSLVMLLRKLFYGDFINFLLKFGQWDKNTEEKNEWIPILCRNLERVRVKVKNCHGFKIFRPSEGFHDELTSHYKYNKMNIF